MRKPRSNCSASMSSTYPAWTRRCSLRATSPRPIPAALMKSVPSACSCRETWRRDRCRLDRRGADRGPSPGDRRAAALFPQSRYRRGSLSERVPARAENLAAERAAARRRRLADHGRPQCRDRRNPATRKQETLPAEEAISDLDDAEDALAERLDGSQYRDDI